MELVTANLTQHIKFHDKKLIQKLCPKCHTAHNNNGIYCSRSCANGRVHSENTKLNIGKGVKTSPKHKQATINRFPPYTKIEFCCTCSKIFIRIKDEKTCSPECKTTAYVNAGYKGGKASAAQSVKRSKDEIALYELCHAHYNMVEHNIPMFDGWDADIIIHDTKTAILWNGPWHYRETGLSNHSLKQVQNRDRIKCDIIVGMGWNVLVFEDRYYTPETAFKEIKSSGAM